MAMPSFLRCGSNRTSCMAAAKRSVAFLPCTSGRGANTCTARRGEPAPSKALKKSLCRRNSLRPLPVLAKVVVSEAEDEGALKTCFLDTLAGVPSEEYTMSTGRMPHCSRRWSALRERMPSTASRVHMRVSSSSLSSTTKALLDCKKVWTHMGSDMGGVGSAYFVPETCEHWGRQSSRSKPAMAAER